MKSTKENVIGSANAKRMEKKGSHNNNERILNNMAAKWKMKKEKNNEKCLTLYEPERRKINRKDRIRIIYSTMTESRKNQENYHWIQNGHRHNSVHSSIQFSFTTKARGTRSSKATYGYHIFVTCYLLPLNKFIFHFHVHLFSTGFSFLFICIL